MDEFDKKCEEAIAKAIDTKSFCEFEHNGIKMVVGRHSSLNALRRIYLEKLEQCI